MRIRLEAGADLVESLAHESDPLRAVLELVWSSLDADAHNVKVDLRRNAADGIEGVSVTDDGHGMSPEAVESAFHWVGNSWKRTTRVTQQEKRPLHGKFGQGRLRAFALGTVVRWETVGMIHEVSGSAPPLPQALLNVMTLQGRSLLQPMIQREQFSRQQGAMHCPGSMLTRPRLE